MMGVIQMVPTQLVTLFADGTVPWCSFVVRYSTRFDEMP
uniref:Uncharacterized protein n=1 Tax=Arundo donax TaxID=35708 RepID=A0A0A9A9W4_ARUDO